MNLNAVFHLGAVARKHTLNDGGIMGGRDRERREQPAVSFLALIDVLVAGAAAAEEAAAGQRVTHRPAWQVFQVDCRSVFTQEPLADQLLQVARRVPHLEIAERCPLVLSIRQIAIDDLVGQVLD